MEIALSDEKTISDFSVTSVLVSAGTGALGVGITTKIEKARRIGTLAKETLEVGADAGLSVGATVLKDDDVTLEGVIADVVGAKLGGRAVDEFTQAAKGARKQASKQQRIANDPKRTTNQRNAASDRAQSLRENATTSEAASGALGAGIGSEAAECAQGEGLCQE